MDVLGDCIQVADSPYPQPEHAVQILTFRQETIQNALVVDAQMGREIKRWKYEAAKGLAQFLADNGYIKWQQIATTEPYKQKTRILYQWSETLLMALYNSGKSAVGLH